VLTALQLTHNIRETQSVLTDVISKRTTFSQPFLSPSDLPANAPQFFLRYQHYMNHLLTYLLTYLLTVCWEWIPAINHPVTNSTQLKEHLCMQLSNTSVFVYLFIHCCITKTTIHLFCVLICHQFQSGQPQYC